MRKPATPRKPTRRSRAHEPPAGPAHPDPAVRRVDRAVLRASPVRHGAAAHRGVDLDRGDAGRDLRAGRLGGVRRGLGLPAGRLAGAPGHRADGGPPVRADAAGRAAARCGVPAACLRGLGPPCAALPCVLPVPADGFERGLPDGRHLQPVRVLRSAADLLVRVDAERRPRRAHACRPALRHFQHRGIDAVPDRAGPAVWPAGFIEHG